MTRTFDHKEDNLEIVINEDGSIESAQAWAPAVVDWLDCTKEIKASGYWKIVCEEKAAAFRSEGHDEISEYKMAVGR